MDYTLEHISGPATEPVSLEEVRAHLNIHDLTLTSAETTNLQTAIRAARREAENHLGRKIGTQVWDVLLHDFPVYDFWRIPLTPVISVDAIYYTDLDGDEATVAPTVYTSTRGMIWLADAQRWPEDYNTIYPGIRVRCTVGMQPISDGGSPETLQYPDNIRQAILFRVGTYWNLREDMTLGATMQAGKVGTFEALLSGERDLRP